MKVFYQMRLNKVFDFFEKSQIMGEITSYKKDSLEIFTL